ncbi:sensor histidine kinase [Hymenobacter sp. GOD-10R]|uniref:sensor histidine kinase n=1 Tax=Hymenobacter sp. GOD-10R TaxID=3093922 RepID=UPI002D7854D8|nr:ATP-binding protein [Hymenobacter sp. GOD-10R]WRQ29357.1 ATP-binding protein [Hymenobacter sp. GOD-10R]
MPANLTREELLTITTFQGLPTETLDWLLAHGERRDYAPDEPIVQPGDPAEYMTAFLQGGVQFFRTQNGHREPRFRIGAGQVSGVLPYSRLQTLPNYGAAVGQTVMFALHRSFFPELERVSPELVQRLVAIMSDRVREETRGQESDEKLRALGKLSAGLAHELNNPAAAIARSAEALADRAATKPALLLSLVRHCPTPESLEALMNLAESACSIEAKSPLSALQRADQEDELADWLEEQGVPDGYQLAGGLIDADITLDQLKPVAADLPKEVLPAALAWLEGQLTTYHLVCDVQEASSRISTLVNNVKTYSHMDRGSDMAPLDVVSGLESTVNMFSYQLRNKNIQLVRDYAPDLPTIYGQVSSLNQVWTNLIDNALDALPNGGTITLRTRREGDFVRVFIIDNGPGIPPNILSRIFEPFFTTKQAGDGTGLGLDIAQRTIRNHNGRLEVQSAPGHTEFCAWLPVA